MTKQALVIVDLQNDFCPGGALAVPGGDDIVPAVNSLVDRFTDAGFPIYATRDWHPAHHISFQERGGPWPPHCVKDTPGAQFHPDFELPSEATVINKAMSQDRDSYSGFDGTDLAHRLKKDGVDAIVVCGLATDYCVKATVLDGLKEGFKVIVAEDAIRGVNVESRDSEKAMNEMKESGAVSRSNEVIHPRP